ncbi:MAG: MgtC/SapB family protein [Acidobacteria bacterium]|nr:MgtC/SapB family protein [Acidobacteriota bacterium]
MALRLSLSFLGGLIIGLNRGQKGRPAGMRTTVLVCLAATIAMLQANALLNTVGKAPDSFVNFDIMRLPLGILTGVGFIGAGAILRRENLVVGVTTAATLWFVTVMGLCFGGGQISIGLAALALGVAVLWCLKWVEDRTGQDRQGTLKLLITEEGITEQQIEGILTTSSLKIRSVGVTLLKSVGERELTYELYWRGRAGQDHTAEAIKQLSDFPGLRKLDWQE